MGFRRFIRDFIDISIDPVARTETAGWRVLSVFISSTGEASVGIVVLLDVRSLPQETAGGPLNDVLH